MKRALKNVATVVLCMCLLCFNYVKVDSAVVQKAEETSTEEVVTAKIMVPEEQVMENIARGILDGEVVGNGVRLRAKASTSATVLELMYNGESVRVNTSGTVNKNGIKWYYVKRVKTGTWGYADSEFILY